MKNIRLWLLMCVCLLSGTAIASNGFNANGRWAGAAFANAAIDFNSDGVFARTFDVKTYDSIQFAGFEGVVDTALVSFGTCAGPTSLELKPFGQFTFRSRIGDALYAEVDPTAPNLCFDPTNPNESLVIRIVGGTGLYQTATGRGTLVIHDVVRLTGTPVILPGVPFPVPPPLVIDTRGEFSLTIQ